MQRKGFFWGVGGKSSEFRFNKTNKEQMMLNGPNYKITELTFPRPGLIYMTLKNNGSLGFFFLSFCIQLSVGKSYTVRNCANYKTNKINTVITFILLCFVSYNRT